MAEPQVIEGTVEEILTLLQSGVFAGRRLKVVIEPVVEKTENLLKPTSAATTAPSLEQFLLEGLDSPVREMTEADWQQIQQNVPNQLASEIAISRKITIHALALDDLGRSVATMGAESQDDATRFLADVQKSLVLLADQPEIGTLRTYSHAELRALRTWLVPAFRDYALFYLTTDNAIEIVRILHGA